MNAKKRIPGKPFLRLANPLLEDLEGKIWEKWQDLALVLCLKAEGDYRTIGDVKGVCGEALDHMMEEARKHLEETSVVDDIAHRTAEVLQEEGMDIRALEEELEEMEDSLITVITTQDAFNGAAAITLPSVQERLREKYGQYYIVPSSIHEMLAFPADIPAGLGINEMIRRTNIQEVPVRDWLGDHAYFYENGKITRVEDPE